MSKASVVTAKAESAFGALMAACTESGASALAVFIDPTLIDPVGDGLAANELVTRHPLTPLREWFPSDRCPYLLRILDVERAWLLVNRSVEQAVSEALDVVEGDLHPRSVCGWIVNPMDCSALARELGAMALVVRPDGTRWPLRFWDPRVTSHLARVLMRDQYAAMRPFLENWRSLDHEGRLVQAAVPASTNAVGRLPLRFDSMQWRALQRVEHVNAVLHMAPESDASQRQVNAKRADEAMQRAERRGYSSDADLRIFAVCALMAHARFDEHPRVDEAIRLAQQNGLSVAAAIDGFDDEFWASLNDGRWLEHHR